MLQRNLLGQARSSSRALGLTIGLGFLSGLAAVASAWLISAVIDRAFLGSQPLDQLRTELALLLAAIVLRSGLTWGASLAASSAALQVKSQLRAWLFDHMLALGPAYARGQRTGEISATVMEGIESLQAYFSQYLPQLVIAALVPLTILLVVLPLDVLSGIVLLVTAPLIPFFMSLIGKSTDALTRRQFKLLGRLSAQLLDSLQGLTTLKALGQSKARAAVVGELSDQYRAATLRVLRVAFLSALVLEIVATIGTAIVAVEVGLRLLYGRMQFQPALFILVLAPEFYLPLRTLGQRFHAAASGASAAQRIFEILDTAVDEGSPALGSAREGAASPAGMELGSIAFRAVRYSYPVDRSALNGVSFELAIGKTLALVGPSGAGKSTIAQLLLRFIEPSGGEIRVGRLPLGAWPADAWRAQLAWVPQRPHLLHDTIGANLRLAKPEASQEAVVQAARQAELHDWVCSLPLGYNTRVGEHGARLSGGQAQRLALARAFLKEAPILLLDEPTSNVDPELDEQLQQAVERLMAGRTVLVIAHRLNTVYRADRIIVLAGGRVVESGRHLALLARDGPYRRLVGAGGAA